jgi:hypothetical protein
MIINISSLKPLEELFVRDTAKKIDRTLSDIARCALLEYLKAHKDDIPQWKVRELKESGI